MNILLTVHPNFFWTTIRQCTFTDLCFNHFKGFLFPEVFHNALYHVKATKSKITQIMFYDDFKPLLCFKQNLRCTLNN